MPAEHRLLGADFVRAAACLMVLAHHLAQRLDPNVLSGGAWTAYTFALEGAFGVAVFFVLSGFLLARPFWQALDAGAPIPSLRAYATRRAARILPGFWLALTVTFLLSIGVFGVPFDDLLLRRYLAGFFLVSEWHWSTLFPVDFNGPLWSIGFEVMSYVLLPIALAALFLLPRSRIWTTRLGWIGVIVLLVAIQWAIVRYLPVETRMRGWQYGLEGGAKVWVPRFNPFGFFAIFAIGTLAAAVQVRWAKRRSWLFDALAIGGLAFAVWSMTWSVGNREIEGFALAGIPYGFPWFPLAVGLMPAALPSSALLGRLADNAPVVFIARISFGIYLWHFLIIELLGRLVWPGFANYGTTDFRLWFAGCAAAVVLSIAAGTLSFYGIERPVIRWARGLEGLRVRSGGAIQEAA